MTAAELDFIGDLAGDDHRVWEAFAFVRLHSPQLTDEQVFAAGRRFLADWAYRGWITATDLSCTSLSPEAFLQTIDRLEIAALDPEHGSDCNLSLTARARQEVPWLSTP
jgi:hypothetical protein